MSSACCRSSSEPRWSWSPTRPPCRTSGIPTSGGAGSQAPIPVSPTSTASRSFSRSDRTSWHGWRAPPTSALQSPARRSSRSGTARRTSTSSSPARSTSSSRSAASARSGPASSSESSLRWTGAAASATRASRRSSRRRPCGCSVFPRTCSTTSCGAAPASSARSATRRASAFAPPRSDRPARALARARREAGLRRPVDLRRPSLHAGPGGARGGRRGDRRRTDRRPRLRPARRPLRAARDPRRELPIVRAGDHSIAEPDILACATPHGQVVLVHFDTHTDTGFEVFGVTRSHGTPMYRLVEDGIVDPRRYVQIGLRGYWPGPREFAWQRERGISSLFMHDVRSLGIAAVVERAVEVAGAGPVFLSVDVDVLDPAFAPGTGTPEPGGMTSSDLLWACRKLASRLDLVGADVVEVIPTAVGSADVTALVAERLVREILTGVALR